MNEQTIQELASLKAAKYLFRSKLNILKNLFKSKKITKTEFIQKFKNLKYEYGPTVVSSLNDPTIVTSLDRYLSFLK